MAQAAKQGRERDGGPTRHQQRVARRTRAEADAVLRRAVAHDTARGRKHRQQVKQALREEAERLNVRNAPTRSGLELPTMDRRRIRGIWQKFGCWGPIGPGVPWHLTSAARIGVLTPFLAPQPQAIPGPIIGQEFTSKQEFTFDPWGAVQAGLITSPGAVVFGKMGSGKSFAVKVIMTRLVQNGRQVIVTSDPKGEWVPLARLVGGQVIAIGPGSRNVINPLDEGQRPAHVDEAAWRKLVINRRVLALKSICLTLRQHQPLTTAERVLLDRVVVAMADEQIEATLTAVVDLLDKPTAALLDKVGAETAANLAMLLGLLVHEGALSGMFHSQTTEILDPTAPMIVIDTSRLMGADDDLREIAASVTSAWIDATLRSQDGVYRCIVSEEGWDEIRNPAQAQAMDERIRMTGHWRCSNWLIFHELSDLKMHGLADSAHRHQVEGIITKAEIKILFRQSSASLDLIDRYVKPTNTERAILSSLKTGNGMWHIGEQTPISARAVAGPGLKQVISTKAGRDGK